LQRAADLLDRYQCDSLALQDLQETANLLQAYNVDERKIMVDFGMAKDFQYYTGLVFEVLHPTLGAGQPLCGGGRYDDLIANLGGNPTPATGCSFDLDRLLLALKAENRFSPKIASTEVLVIAEASHAYAIQVAEGLRQAGISVQLDRTRKPPISNLPWTIRVGAAEQQQQTVRLEREGRQQLVTLPAAIHQIQQKN
jgi:histidyl-tRNA synthetase